MSRPVPALTRRFEFIAGSSAKFWEVCVDGKEVTVRFGRIGSVGQSQTKTLPGVAKAHEQVAKWIAQKLAKGYQEVGPASAA